MIDLARLRVLLVEDNELDRRMMLRRLQDFDQSRFEVECVANLQNALAAIEQERFDCVLLDLSLPDSSGLASVDALLERSPITPVVVLTGLDDPQTAVEAVNHGAQDYLTKNHCEGEVVGRAIRYAVTRQHNETQLRSTRDLLSIMTDRERIGRDLHDLVIQQLFATGMSLQGLASQLDRPDQREHLLNGVGQIDESIRHLRETIFEFHSKLPATLTEEVLQLAKETSPSLGCTPTVRVDREIDQLPADMRRDLLSILTEGLSNVAKHAEATAVQIILEVDREHAVLQVIDNGTGLGDAAGASPEEGIARKLTGRGLKNIRARADKFGGEFHIGPGPGGGTLLEWRARID